MRTRNGSTNDAKPTPRLEPVSTLEGERLYSLKDIARGLPSVRNGRPVNVATCWRWTSKGVRGEYLEYTCVGGTRCTSREAVARFFARLKETSNPPAPAPVESPAARRNAAAKADRELEKLGV